MGDGHRSFLSYRWSRHTFVVSKRLNSSYSSCSQCCFCYNPNFYPNYQCYNSHTSSNSSKYTLDNINSCR